MTQIVLLHSALGLTRHVQDWAEALRLDGHDVITPDLFGGVTFDDLDEGVAHVEAEGMGAWVKKARKALATLDGPRVYAGFSFGGAIAEALAFTDEEAVGLAVMHAAVSPAWFDVTEWPTDLSAQVHYARDDEWVDVEEAEALMALAGDACEEFVYSGSAHLFAFEGWHEYDSEASHLLFERLGDFLAEFD